MIKKDREMLYMMFCYIMGHIFELNDNLTATPEDYFLFLRKLKAWRDEE